MDNTDIEHSHIVYAYDPNQKKYFKAYHTDNQSLKSVVDKDETGKLNISLEKETAADVQQPLNYRLTVTLRPKPEEQIYITAVSETQKNCHQYGVTNA
ncbi:hypothetical protein BGC07_03770 [Piscirickettsia litoralis]|uniref:Uncharacterized protein n=2 Tax=Piscirickettsia litoralis TaxID=1891921 RepID=A0ABX3A028_9GAMM|nr:hypothetical protein BGC07_03770 [Piscirickettsia litoralis]